MPNENQRGYSIFGHFIDHNKEITDKSPPTVSFGQKAAEKIACTVGSWKFIIIQSMFLLLWGTANVIFISYSWDPYPFILMNLFLSLQAAYTAPMILMSQNRQSAQDRSILFDGWKIDKKISDIVTEMDFDVDSKLLKQEEKLDLIIELLNKK